MILMSVIAFMAVTSLSGCETADEAEHRRSIERLKVANGQDAIEQEMRHERSMAYIQRPIAPGSYIDYRGNTQHGYWQNGHWMWNDPQSRYAVASGHYVDYGMATGSLTTAALTYALFSRNNSNGWTHTEVTVNNYTSVDNEVISKEKYNKRNKSLTKKKKAQDRKRKAAKAKSPKTVSKSTGTKKVDSKWKSKRKVEPEYGKKGFKSNFRSNKQKAADRKSYKAKNQTKYKQAKSTYKKQKPSKQQRPKKQQRRNK